MRLEGVAPLHRIVAHVGESHRELAPGQHLEEVVAQLGEPHRPLAARRAAVHLHEVADIGPLGPRQPLEPVIVEDQRGTLPAEGGAARGVIGLAATCGDLPQDFGHGGHGVLVTRVHDGLGPVEVEHPGIHGPADRDAAPFGQRVVGLLHGQHESLVHDVAVAAGRGVARGADRSHDEIGTERRVERLPREVVVDAAVVEQHRIRLHGLEHQGNGHRGAHRLAQLAPPQHHRTAVVHVAGHAEEGDHQAVEIAVGGGRRRSEQLGERHVDLRGGDEVRRHTEPFPRRAFDVDAQAQERGVAPHLPVVVEVAVGVDAPRNPLPDHARADDRTHLRRGVARRIHGRDDRAHRRPGHAVDRHAALLERLQHADMVEPLRPAAAHHDPDALPRRGQRPGEQKQDKSDRFTQHISIFL